MNIQLANVISDVVLKARRRHDVGETGKPHRPGERDRAVCN